MKKICRIDSVIENGIEKFDLIWWGDHPSCGDGYGCTQWDEATPEERQKAKEFLAGAKKEHWERKSVFPGFEEEGYTYNY